LKAVQRACTGFSTFQSRSYLAYSAKTLLQGFQVLSDLFALTKCIVRSMITPLFDALLARLSGMIQNEKVTSFLNPSRFECFLSVIYF